MENTPATHLELRNGRLRPLFPVQTSPLTAHAPLAGDIFPECGGQKAVGARTSAEPEPDSADPGLGPGAHVCALPLEGARQPGPSHSCPESPFSSGPSNPYGGSCADVRGRLARAE